MSEAVIKLENIVKSYGKHEVLKGVNMQVNRGDIYGLVGKNGAGKTTIFKMILGLSEYTSGTVSIAGSKNKRELFANRRKVGFFVGSNFYGYLSARDNLQYYARAKGIPHKEIKNEITRVLEIVGLEDNKKPYKGYSLGMKQRLGIGNAILGNPEILILDEPTNGLDPQGIADVRHMIRHIRDEYNMTIIVSSHILGELEHTADRFGIVHNGIVAKEITQDDLKSKKPEVNIALSSDDIERAQKLLAENGINILHEVADKMTLEDFYFDLIGGGAN
ncbi:MAG: ABC transporter ATP-binding protein [Acutalibacteraceae bacterium]|nr:ABC transporter ATP-binding protein [Clostridia bacterium]MEE3449457.1 ABC transporter ATP-binding protein [Acutalibacteraceae bacterium]